MPNLSPAMARDKKDISVETSLVAGNIKIGKRRTSVRLEPAMWAALHEIASLEQKSIHDLCTVVDAGKAAGESFSSALRVFLLRYYRRMVSQLKVQRKAVNPASRRSSGGR